MNNNTTYIPPIAVIMATYNGEHYLEEQIESILNQSLAPSVVIIVDDGSIDGTCVILEKYANEGKITYLKNDTRHGVVGNFINGLKHLPVGNYFALADQDDIWTLDKLEKCYAALKNIEIDTQPCMVYSDLCLVDAKKKIINKSFRNELGHHKYVHCLDTLLYGNFVLGCTTLSNYVMKDYIVQMPHDPSFNHDAWMALAAYSIGKSTSIDEPLVNYRQHSNNVTISSHKKRSLIYRYATHFKLLFTKNDFLEDRFTIVKLFMNQYQNSLSENHKKKMRRFLKLQNNSYIRKKIAFEISFFNKWTNRFS